MDISDIEQFKILTDSNIFTLSEIQININKLNQFWRELNNYQQNKNQQRMQEVINNETKIKQGMGELRLRNNVKRNMNKLAVKNR
jgi:hypothetical protein